MINEFKQRNTTHSLTSDVEHTHKSTSIAGNNPTGRDLVIVPPGEVEKQGLVYNTLEGLPNEIQQNIFRRLPVRDIIALQNTSMAVAPNADQVLHEECERWFYRVPPQQQATFKNIADGLSEQDLRNRLSQLTNDELFIDHLIGLRNSPNFPQLYFYTTNRLLAECQTLGAKQASTTSLRGTIDWANFSYGGSYMLTGSSDKTATLYKFDEEEWKYEATINHGERVCSAKFSSDARHFATRSTNDQVKIYDQSRDGLWSESPLFQEIGIKWSDFSSNGSRVATINNDGKTLEIFSWNGVEWIKEFSIIPDGSDIYFAFFIGDSNHVFINGHSTEVTIYGPNNHGQWEQKHFTPRQPNGFVPVFSPNGSHLITPCGNTIAKSLILDEEESWRQDGILILDRNKPIFPIFNNEGTHIAIAGFDHEVKIHTLSDQMWLEEFAVRHSSDLLITGGLIGSTTFSPNGKHLVTPFMDGTVKVISRNKDGKWAENTAFKVGDGRLTIFFSQQGNHFAASCLDKVVIYALNEQDQWTEKVSIFQGEKVIDTNFSPDNLSITTLGPNTAKIWALCSQEVNTPFDQDRPADYCRASCSLPPSILCRKAR